MTKSHYAKVNEHNEVVLPAHVAGDQTIGAYASYGYPS